MRANELNNVNRVSCAHTQFQTQTQVPLDCFASGSVEVGSANKGNTEGDEDPQTSLKRYQHKLTHTCLQLLFAPCQEGQRQTSYDCMCCVCICVCVCIVHASAYRARKDNGTCYTSTRARRKNKSSRKARRGLVGQGCCQKQWALHDNNKAPSAT